MLGYRDFVPKMTSYQAATYQTFDEALAAADKWIIENHIEVFNVETVVLPNIHEEHGSMDPSLITPHDQFNSWHQFIRVWHRTA